MSATTLEPGLPPARTLSRARVVLRLAMVESRRMVTMPWLLLVVPLTWWVGNTTLRENWSGAAYQALPTVVGPALMAVSLVVALACLRDTTPLAEDAPVGVRHRTAARLLAGVPFVAVMALVVTGVALWLRARGGLDLGDEPGRTLHAHFTLPELLQPMLLTALAVALGGAVARLVRNRLGAATLLFLIWFVSTLAYWVFNGPALRVFALVQTQPVVVPVARTGTDPLTLPSSWLLSAPGQYQDFWGRVVVSPQLAAWHDVYLVGLTALLAGLALRGRFGRALVVTGLVVAAAAVVLQKAVHP
jgi:hypothetical protein